MAAPRPSKAAALIMIITAQLVVLGFPVASAAPSWCVARSEASDQALQTALDYACGTGADCTPIQSSGLCFLPNTIQAHASYAFNSYYQRKAMAPGSCDFSGTATVAKTEPSYGSCVYPSSSSTAGGTIPPGTGTTTPTTTPITNAPPQPLGTSPTFGTGVNPGTGSVLPDAPPSPSQASLESSFTKMLIHFSFFLVLLFISEPF